DLFGLELSFETSDAARAKHAAHRAAHLRGDALGEARRPIVVFFILVVALSGFCFLEWRRKKSATPRKLRDEHALDARAVVKTNEELSRRVGGSLLVRDLRRHPHVELFSKCRRQIRHLRRIGHAARLEPAEDLLAVERTSAEDDRVLR